MSTPCFIITRDRVSYTRPCIESLSKYPDLDIHIVDHGSTYGPMLDYLDTLSYPIHWRGNCAPHSLWRWQKLEEIVKDSTYVVTDPDVVIDDSCPDDWLLRLQFQLERWLRPRKAGLGIRLDDLPRNELGMAVRGWEERFWDIPGGDGVSFKAPVDTTLALYQPLSLYPDFNLFPAVRLAPPYLIRHLPWYDDLQDDESAYYRERILPGTSHWINGGW